MNTQVNNFDFYYFDDGWGQYVDIELNYSAYVSRPFPLHFSTSKPIKPSPMSVQVPLNSQFKNYNYVINKKLMPIIETHNNVDYYDDVEKNDVEEILKKIQEKDEVGYNLNIFTFIKITFVTIVGLFCVS